MSRVSNLVLAQASLGVLSFNIWRDGGRSLDLTIAAIRGSRADIVGLQECKPATARTIARRLSLHAADDGRSNVILSRFPITGVIGPTADEWGGFGATIELSPGQRVHVFDAHLHYGSYGPYHLQAGRSADAILHEEHSIRMPGLDELLVLMTDSLESDEPTFLVGDFNAPSHLDYASLAWPESIMVSQRGLVDSYRSVHPGNRTYPGPFAFDEPGITWTPIVAEEARGTFDRIDFVYFRSPEEGAVVPSSSTTLDERNAVGPWPSDHRAVLSRFALA